METGNRQYDVDFSFAIEPMVLCYSIASAKGSCKLVVSLTNHSPEPIDDFVITFNGSNPFLLNLDKISLAGKLGGGDSSQNTFSKAVQVNFQQPYFSRIVEQSKESVAAVVTDKAQGEIASQTCPITIKPMDFWNFDPQCLAVFIERNNPYIKKIPYQVAQILESINGENSLLAYQSHKVQDVLDQCSAVYTFLQNQDFVYTESLAGDSDGQRIRSFEDIFTHRTATCLDTTLLFCSIAEAIGLHPIVCLEKNHCWPAVWLNEEDSFDSVVHDDNTDISQNCTPDNQRLLAFESTLLTNKPKVSFQEACRVAYQKASSAQSLVILDVYLARKKKIFPMAYQQEDEKGNLVFIQDNEFSTLDNRLMDGGAVNILNESVDNAPKTRLEAWQRKLLDSSTRNPLLNVKTRSKATMLLCPDLVYLENQLSMNKEFTLIGNPTDDVYDPGSLDTLTKSQDILLTLNHKGRIACGEKEEELEKKLSKIYIQEQKDLSETGSNTLYLTIGSLVWYDKAQGPKYTAPILLYPINLIRRSRTEYSIKIRDDEEPVLNYSIFEKLRNEMGLNIGLDYNNLPQDQSGLDVDLILNTIRQAILRQKKWAVVSTSVLGLFSFDQMVMYNDLRMKSEALQTNKVVKSLISNKLCFKPKPLTPISDDDQIAFNVPLSCDQTQLKAIKAALSGNSFILQGPPGTGKSQTITALIAQAISKGKKVLFVAEKMAALQVVYRNLSQIGISDYLLELHSIKASKEHFINQLSQSLQRQSLPASSEPSFGKMLKTLDRDLFKYVKALHTPLPCNMSLYDLINAYEGVKAYPVVSLTYNQISDVTSSHLEECRNLMFILEQKQSTFGKIDDNPFSLIKRKSELHTSLYAKVQLLTKDLSLGLEKFSELINTIQGGYKSPVSFSVIDSLSFYESYRQKLLDFGVNAFIIGQSEELIQRNLDKLILYRGELKSFDSAVENRWNMDIVKENIPLLLQRWGLCRTGLFKGKQRKALVNIVGSYALFPIDQDNLEPELRKLNALSPIKERLQALEGDIDQSYLSLKDEALRNPKAFIQAIANYRGLCSKIAGERVHELYNSPLLDRLFTLSQRLDELYVNLCSLLDIDKKSFENKSIEESLKLCSFWSDNTQRIVNWIEYNRTLYRLESRFGFARSFVRNIQASQSVEENFKSLLASFYKAQIQHELEQNSVLLSFTSTSFENAVSQLQQTEQNYRSYLKENLGPSIEQTVKSRNLDGESIRQLKVFIGRHGRSCSIRKIFETCDKTISDLLPCFLMSPLSVSQYLEPAKQLFDLVIFDEASQIPTCKAIGAMARAKDVIVVGDSKQMPPTSFFKKLDSLETFDYDEQENSDLDSILEDCLAISMPESKLEWHYRSNNESLIYFSNSRYYNGRLKTYPSVDSKTSKVVLRQVRGYYQSDSRAPNEAEADAIAMEIKKRLSNSATSKESIAVITFNEKQQNLIQSKLDDLFERERKLSEAAHWNQSEIDCPQKLIVKNLENIQGDERDVVMLSVTFGPSASGHFSKNFGPINQIGGQKRLNVAFSRAKKLMLVFTIIDLAQLSSDDLRTQGAKDLFAFLKYAANPFLREPVSRSQSQIKDALAQILRDAGLFVQEDVGMSDFKVDIAVQKSQEDKTFFCAVMLDGSSLLSSELTNDRFNLNRSILKNRGWQIVPVRVLDYYSHPQETAQRVVQEVKEAQDNIQESIESVAEEPKQDLDSFAQSSEYRVCKLDMDPMSPSAFANVDILLLKMKFEQVIEAEGPILEDLLQTRVIQSFKIKKRGSAVSEVLDRVQKNLDHPKTLEIDYQDLPHRVFWPMAYKDCNPERMYKDYRVSSPSDPDKRSFDEIPQVEIRNCMLSLIKVHGELEQSLKEQTFKKLGFSRKGAAIQSILDNVYQQAIDGRIIALDPVTRRIVPVDRT